MAPGIRAANSAPKEKAVAQAFQGALAHLAVLHDQEVEALQSQVFELRHHLKRLSADCDRDLALSKEVLTTEVAAEITAAAVAACKDGACVEAGPSSFTASVHNNGGNTWCDLGTEPHPCAKPHLLPPTFWNSPPQCSGGPGERDPDERPLIEEASQVYGEAGAVQRPLIEEAPFAPLKEPVSVALAKDTDAPQLEATASIGTRGARRLSDDNREVSQHAERIKKELEQITSPAAKRLAKAKIPGHGHRNTFREHKWTALWLAEHAAFDWLCALMIILNSALVGCIVVWQTDHDQKNTVYQTLSHLCSAFFFLELSLRMYALGCRTFFMSEGRGWNTFDFLLVVSSFFDIGLQALATEMEGQGQVGIMSTGMKTIKIMRIVRVFRVFRFFKELSLLALMIVDSMKSLAWAIVMVMIVVYVFAILFTDSAVEFKKVAYQNPDEVDAMILPDLERSFGTLSKTVYTLIQATLGGVSWGVITDTLLDYDVTMAFLFFFYLAFTILAVLNIITGVFVDNAVETAQTQREFLVQKEMELKEKYVFEMKNLFDEMDSDGNGTVTMEEIQEYLQDTRIMSYFQALGLDPNDTERLFRLIDDDQSGGISVDEFLTGCLRLKGQARSIDIHALIHDLKKMFARFERIENLMGGRAKDTGEEASLCGCGVKTTDLVGGEVGGGGLGARAVSTV